MKIRTVILTFIAVFGIMPVFSGCTVTDSQEVSGAADIGGAYAEMYSADFWTEKDDNKELLTADEIQLFNYNMKNSTAKQLLDLYSHPEEISKDELTKRLNTYGIPAKPRFTGTDGRTTVTNEYYNKLRANRNMSAVKDINPVVPAVIVNETSLRDFPDSAPSYDEEGNMDIDLFHENRMKVWDRCLILHTSADGLWYFIQTTAFRGWISAADAAICTKDDWLKYDSMDFLMVTGNRIRLDMDPYDASVSGKEMLMGTRIPIAGGQGEVNRVSSVSSYTVLLPYRGEGGKLVKKIGRVPKNADVNEGYLSFTSGNVIRQSFKMLGERYGWGGSLEARDCSSFIRDIFFCFGLELPRNSASQGAMQTEERLDVSYLEDGKKEEAILSREPGAILEMPGHVMLYLGEYNGKAYVIHSVYAFGESGKNGAEGRRNISCVTVSDLYVTREDGSTFLSNIRNVAAFG